MEGLPKAYNPSETEPKIYRLWEEGGYFKPRKAVKKFVVWMAPPNITGNLHMGHALENTLLDVIVRIRRMQGYETLWIPGTDHAGIATQNVVEKELKKEGISREALGREKFIERAWKWRERYGNIIIEQLKKLGVSPDWSRLAFTLDPDYTEAVLKAFLIYHKEGWVYRARKVGNWCPRCGTTISDLEVKHKNVPGKLWYIRYPLKDEIGHITVATTRPETMLGDTAVAVNPKDSRYKDLIGKTAILPIVNREIPIITDVAVDPKFGTGAVKVTPAHDITDYEMSLRHKLPMIEVINKHGKMTPEAGAEFEWLDVHEAREKVVDKLNALGLIEKIEDYTISIGSCERCDTTIEPLPSWQWFLKMKELAKLGMKPVISGKTKLIPPRWKKPYLTWMRHVRDWPISRQLWWGHRLPVWQCRCQIEENSELRISQPRSSSAEERRNSRLNHQKLDESFVVSLTKPRDKCRACGSEYEQVSDVLDTWFSSALWPFATLGWPRKTADLKRYYPGNLISSAPEILHLWIGRMIFSGMYFMRKPPFATEYVHATVLTKEGRRMSKSLGTGVDPQDLISRYGADATRFGLVWQTTGGQAVRFDETTVEAGKKFANKLWNASRFILMRVTQHANIKKIPSRPPRKNLSATDKKLIADMKKTIAVYERDIAAYRFGQAIQLLYHFFWHTFCDKYIEYTKQETRAEVDLILYWALGTFLKIVHPIMPFVTETIWQHLPPREKDPLIIQRWPAL